MKLVASLLLGLIAFSAAQTSEVFSGWAENHGVIESGLGSIIRAVFHSIWKAIKSLINFLKGEFEKVEHLAEHVNTLFRSAIRGINAFANYIKKETKHLVIEGECLIPAAWHTFPALKKAVGSSVECTLNSPLMQDLADIFKRSVSIIKDIIAGFLDNTTILEDVWDGIANLRGICNDMSRLFHDLFYHKECLSELRLVPQQFHSSYESCFRKAARYVS